MHFLNVILFAVALCLSGSPDAFSAPAGPSDHVAQGHSVRLILDESRAQQTIQKLVATTGTLRVFWWNIEDSILNRQLPQRSLDINLRALVQSVLRPDIIALGEFSPASSLEDSTRRLLEERYPNHFFIPYNSKVPGEGVGVYIKPQAAQVRTTELDWVPLKKMNTAEIEEFRNFWAGGDPDAVSFTRTYSRFDINVGGTLVSLIPTHMIQPWSHMRAKLTRETTAAWAYLRTGAEVVSGSDNPYMYQATRFRRNLERDFGPFLDQGSPLVIGDFNIPDSVGSIHPVGYSLVKGPLKDAFVSSPKSFPSASDKLSKGYSPMKIDHAFVSRRTRVKAAEVLELQGSDHYPLYLILEP